MTRKVLTYGSWGTDAEDLGFTRDTSHAVEKELFYVRSELAVAARAANILSLDTPNVNFKNEEALVAECSAVKSYGFKGKFAIHPNQVEVINKVFGVSKEEYEHAKRVVDAFDASVRDQGRGSIDVDGRMVDIPVYKRYKRVVQLYEIQKEWFLIFSSECEIKTLLHTFWSWTESQSLAKNARGRDLKEKKTDQSINFDLFFDQKQEYHGQTEEGWTLWTQRDSWKGNIQQVAWAEEWNQIKKKLFYFFVFNFMIADIFAPMTTVCHQSEASHQHGDGRCCCDQDYQYCVSREGVSEDALDWILRSLCKAHICVHVVSSISLYLSHTHTVN